MSFILEVMIINLNLIVTVKCASHFNYVIFNHILVIGILGISFEWSLIECYKTTLMPVEDHIHDKSSTLFQVMDWCHRATSHCLACVGQVYICQGYPGYFWEPHWKSMGLPEISRVTWHLSKFHHTIASWRVIHKKKFWDPIRHFALVPFNQNYMQSVITLATVKKSCLI